MGWEEVRDWSDEWLAVMVRYDWGDEERVVMVECRVPMNLDCWARSVCWAFVVVVVSNWPTFAFVFQQRLSMFRKQGRWQSDLNGGKHLAVKKQMWPDAYSHPLDVRGDVSSCEKKVVERRTKRSKSDGWIEEINGSVVTEKKTKKKFSPVVESLLPPSFVQWHWDVFVARDQQRTSHRKLAVGLVNCSALAVLTRKSWNDVWATMVRGSTIKADVRPRPDRDCDSIIPSSEWPSKKYRPPTCVGHNPFSNVEVSMHVNESDLAEVLIYGTMSAFPPQWWRSSPF